MPNWKKIRRLRDIIAKTKYNETRQFKMDEFIQIISNPGNKKSVTIAELRSNGPECGSAACLAGETVIHLGDPRQRLFFIKNELTSKVRCNFSTVANGARKLLGLTSTEAGWMFRGHWARYRDWIKKDPNEDLNVNSIPLPLVSQALAIRYLNRVLKLHNVKTVVRQSYKS